MPQDVTELAERLQKELKFSPLRERHFIVARMMIARLDDGNPLKEQLSALASDPFKFQSYDSFDGRYFVLNEESQKRADELEAILKEHMSDLAKSIIEEVPEEPADTFDDRINSHIYGEFCQRWRDAMDLKAHDLGGEILYRGVPASVIDGDNIEEFFKHPHRGTYRADKKGGGHYHGLFEYGIANRQKPSLTVGNSVGRATNATSLTAVLGVATKYATDGYRDRFEKHDVGEGWVIICRGRKGCNPQLMQNRWYAEIACDEIAPEDMLAVCKIKVHSPGEYEITEIHENPQLQAKDKTELNTKLKELNLSAGCKLKRTGRADWETEIKEQPLARQITLGKPIIGDTEGSLDTVPQSPQEKRLFKLLDEVLSYIAKYPAKSLRNDRGSDAFELAELIIQELKIKDKTIGEKSETVAEMCRNMLKKNPEGELSRSLERFVKQKQPDQTLRSRDTQYIGRQLNEFAKLRQNLSETAKTKPSRVVKFLNWLKSAISSSPKQALEDEPTPPRP